MEFRRADASAERRSDGDGRFEPALAPVPESGDLAGHLVHGLVGEAEELDLRHRHHPGHGQAHRGAGDHALRQRGVDHAALAELLEEPLCGTEYTTVPADVLA